MTADPYTRRLLIRASSGQIMQIKQVLLSYGETGTGSYVGTPGPRLPIRSISVGDRDPEKILRMLQQVVKGARDQGIPVAVCGEMAADPLLVQLLVGLGLRELSVQPRAIGPVREALRKLNVKQSERLALEALEDPAGSKLAHRLR